MIRSVPLLASQELDGHRQWGSSMRDWRFPEKSPAESLDKWAAIAKSIGELPACRFLWKAGFRLTVSSAGAILQAYYLTSLIQGNTSLL
jgi:hypothetical protein